MAEEGKLITDTTAQFEEVFGDKTEFDSWEEFTTLFEEFQKKSGSVFKPRSASSVEYANERRINGPIPDRFVYANVKMICCHYGEPVKRGSGHRKNYIAKGCGAFLNLSYNHGALKITRSTLVHSNHELGEMGEGIPLRQLRVFTFSDDLDLVIAREVNEANPFEYANGEKKWLEAVENLRVNDERLHSITPRVVKKRIRFLVDKFLAISHGKVPSEEDELGTILYNLDQTRRETLDNPLGRGKKRKSGRPRKKRNFAVFNEDDDDFDDPSYSPSVQERDTSPVTPSKKKTKSAASSSSTTSSEISSFITYLQKKDEQERRLRQQEIDLRKEELALHKKELEVQKQRLEIDRVERKAHLDLLNAQLRAFAGNNSVVKEEGMEKSGEHVTEYTIVVDNNQVLEGVPGM